MAAMNSFVSASAATDINRLPCVFRKALLARHAVCECAARDGARGTLVCAQPLARASCGELQALLRDKSAFALGMTDTRRAIAPAKLLKIQSGGLNGLRDLLDPGAIAPSVHRLVRLATERHGDLAALPFAEIVKGIAAWTPKHQSANV
jgi:hypothetical protein